MSGLTLEKENERRLYLYNITYKRFVASITIDRGAMDWEYGIQDKNGIEIDRRICQHFMSELDIENAIKIVIDDCIRNPAEYYGDKD